MGIGRLLYCWTAEPASTRGYSREAFNHTSRCSMQLNKPEQTATVQFVLVSCVISNYLYKWMVNHDHKFSALLTTNFNRNLREEIAYFPTLIRSWKHSLEILVMSKEWGRKKKGTTCLFSLPFDCSPPPGPCWRWLALGTAGEERDLESWAAVDGFQISHQKFLRERRWRCRCCPQGCGSKSTVMESRVGAKSNHSQPLEILAWLNECMFW